MSRTVKWTIPFASVNGASYVISVYEEGFTGTATQLSPAGHPMEVAMENTDDIIMQLRTQTGYIRTIEASGARAMKPTNNLQYYVTLAKVGTVVWQGYLQASSYSSQYETTVHECEYPVVSPLKAMESVRISKDAPTGMSSGMCKFAQLLVEAMDAVAVEYSAVWIPTTITKAYSVSGHTSDIHAALNAKVSRYAFLSRNSEKVSDAAYVEYEGATWAEVLQAICQFFGWSAVEDGTALIFTDELSPTYRKYTRANLVSIVSGQSPTGLETKSVTAATLAVDATTLDGSENTETCTQGVSKVVLNAKLQSVESPISPPECTDRTGYATTSVDVRVTSQVRARRSSMAYMFDDGGEYVCHSYRGTTETAYSPATDLAGLKTGMRADIVQIDQWDTTATDKFNYAMTDAVRLYCPFSPVPSQSEYDSMKDKPLLTVRSSRPVTLHEGALCLSASLQNSMFVYLYDTDNNVWNSYDKDTSGLTVFGPAAEATMRISLRFGTKYYDGSAWVDALSIFEVAVSEDAMADYCNRYGKDSVDFMFSTGRVKNTKTLSQPYNGAEGYIIPISAEMAGDVELTIYPWKQQSRSFGNDHYGTAVIRMEPEYTAVYLSNLAIDYYDSTGPVGQASGNVRRGGGIQSGPNDVQTGVSKNRYCLPTGASFDGENETTVPVATNNHNVAGDTLVMYGSDYLQKFGYSPMAIAVRPEEWLLGRLKGIYSKTHTVTCLALQESTSLDCFKKYNSKWRVTGIDRDFAEESESVKLYNLNE